jgi:hypothetical protein
VKRGLEFELMRERETQEQIRREATSTKAIGNVEFAKLHNQLRAEEAVYEVHGAHARPMKGIRA